MAKSDSRSSPAPKKAPRNATDAVSPKPAAKRGKPPVPLPVSTGYWLLKSEAREILKDCSGYDHISGDADTVNRTLITR